jgi:hypothetical protein
MSYRHTLEAVLESLQEVGDLIRAFPEDSNIPAIELDLSLQKLRNVYELLLMMRQPAVVQPVTDTATRDQLTAPAEKPGARVSPVIPAAPTEKVSPAPKDTGREQILSDRFKGRATLHESLHQTLPKETLASGKPVSDLMSAIGINDRFTFIRELFNNDARAFEATLGILNDCASFNDAYNYMIQYHDWDMDSEPVQLLLEIIRRKYITGRHE